MFEIKYKFRKEFFSNLVPIKLQIQRNWFGNLYCNSNNRAHRDGSNLEKPETAAKSKFLGNKSISFDWLIRFTLNLRF